jgi:hypothetical protein
MSAPVTATEVFVPTPSDNNHEDLNARIAQLEQQRDIYESDVKYYGEKIQEYESYLSSVGGWYWEDDTINRDEAKRRHETYKFHCSVFPELLETFVNIKRELRAMYEERSIISG